MFARLCVVALCLAGCDRLFGLTHVDDVPPDAPADSAFDGPVQCPITYDVQVTDSPSRYRLQTNTTSWDAAQIACAADSPGGTHLVVLDDDDERIELITALTQRGQTGSTWIGLSDRNNEGAYLWVTQQEVGAPPLTSPPWGVGQPDDQSGLQDCVRIQGSSSTSPALLDDGECGSQFGFVCECDGFAPDTNNF